MSALGNYVVSIALDGSKFSQGVNKTEKDTLRLAAFTQGSMERMERSVQSYIGRVAGIGAAYLSIDSVFSSFNKQVDALAQLDDAAQKTGASVELLSKLQKTAVAFGEDFSGKVEPAITKLARGIAGLEDPSNKANAALAALGIQSRDANGNLRDSAQITIDVAKALQNYRDNASKAALVTDLFGKSGAELLPFLNDAAGSVDQFSGASAAAAGNAAALQDSLNAQKQRWDEFTQQLTIGVLPAMTDIAGAFLDIQGNGQSLANDKAITNWADNLALTIAPVYDTLVNLKNEVYAVGKSFQVVLADINVAAARLKTFNPAAYITGDPQKALNAAYASREQVLSEANAAYADAASRPRDQYEAALRARMANRPNQYGSPVVTGLSNKPAIGYVSGQNAKDAAEATKAASEAASAKKAYDSLTDSINKQIEAKRAEYSVTGPLTEAEKIMLDVNLKRADGQLKLTDAQYKNVQALTATLDAETRNAEMSALRLQSEKEYLSQVESATAARDDQVLAAQDETKALEDMAQAKLAEIEQLSMTRNELEALQKARFDEQIGVLETQKAYLASQPDRENEIELIQRQIDALGILRDSVGKSEAITKSKDEVNSIFGSMEQTARLAWTVFANSGTNAAQAVGKSIKASILDLLYQLTIKKFFVNISANVGAGDGLMKNILPSNQNGSIFDRVADGFSLLNSDITGSIEKLGAFLSNGQGGLADKIGGFLGQYSNQIASGIGYLSSAYMLSQGNIAGAALTAAGTYFGGPIGGAIGAAIGGLFGGKSPPMVGSQASGTYSNGAFSGTFGRYGSKDIGAGSSLNDLNKAFATSLGALLSDFGLSDRVTATSIYRQRTNVKGFFGSSFDGGNFYDYLGKGISFEDFANTILGPKLVKAIEMSKLPESIKNLFDGITDKTQVQNMIAATMSLNDAQDVLTSVYGLTAESAASVANATGLAGDNLTAFISTLIGTANSSQTVSEQMIQQRDKLNASLVSLGANSSINANLEAFDAFLKSLPKDTAAAQKQFADLFNLRGTVGSVQSAWDELMNGVSAATYSILPQAEQQAKDAAALTKMFADLGLTVPESTAQLAALGQSIQQNFNAADEASIDLALAFPTLVQAFTAAKDKVTETAREMNQFTSLADFRFYKGVANNYGSDYANSYAGVSRLLGSNAQGETTLNGESVADLKKLLADLRDTTKQALVTQRATTTALEQIQARGLKTV